MYCLWFIAKWYFNNDAILHENDLHQSRTDNVYIFSREKYSMLVEELKDAFHENGWLLSAAVPAPKFRVDSGFDVKRWLHFNFQ